MGVRGEIRQEEKKWLVWQLRRRERRVKEKEVEVVVVGC